MRSEARLFAGALVMIAAAALLSSIRVKPK